MRPNLQWHFKGKSETTGALHTVTMNAPVGTSIEALRYEAEMSGYRDPELSHMSWEKWAWPGGYPIYYVCKDGGILCPDCANKEIALTSDPDADDQWNIVDLDINYEDPHLTCDHCNKFIGSAYADEINESLEE